MSDTGGRSRRMLGRIALAGTVGAVVFVLAQEIAGYPQNIAGFMGSQVTNGTGLSGSWSGVIGWLIHLSVAWAYAGLFGLLLQVRRFRSERGPRLREGLGLALALGYASGIAAPTAISITLGMLTGSRLPDPLPGLNLGLGFAVWNHIGFFLVCFVFLALVPSFKRVGGVDRGEPGGGRCASGLV